MRCRPAFVCCTSCHFLRFSPSASSMPAASAGRGCAVAAFLSVFRAGRLCTARRAQSGCCVRSGVRFCRRRGLAAPYLSSDAFGCFFLLLAAPYFFFAVRNDAVFPDKASGAARGGLGGGCKRAAGLSEIPAPRRRVHRFRLGMRYGAAAYVFAAACIRRRAALDFMSGGVRLRTVRRRGAARRRTMI